MTLKTYLNLMALEDLPEWSAAPATREPGPLLEAIRGAGYDGVQFVRSLTSAERAACDSLGLGRCGLGRVNSPEEAAPLAARLAGEGMECGTIHLGWGIESDSEASALIEALLEASSTHRIPLYVETHRATLFQDMWRSVQFVNRFPGLRFNGDFSHWYTGNEMVYGDFDVKLRFIAPVLERVRFLHGRIGNPGSIQVDIGEGDESAHPYIAHFKALWVAAMRGARLAAQQEAFLFVPELLSPRIHYGRMLHTGGGRPSEECDRWTQSLVLKRLAAECWQLAAPH
jgi:hypothetical protein